MDGFPSALEQPKLILPSFKLVWGPVPVWVLSGYPGFLPPSKTMSVRLTDDPKMTVRVRVSIGGCFSLR